MEHKREYNKDKCEPQKTKRIHKKHRLRMVSKKITRRIKQVAQWATIAHLRASIMFGDTIIYDAQ